MLPVGTPIGAVNVVAAPLAVWIGEKVPHTGALPQTATQSTPAFATSFVTVAATNAVALTDMEEGGLCIRDIETVGVSGSLEPVIAHPAAARERARRSTRGR
jgi:hypothetical protein